MKIIITIALIISPFALQAKELPTTQVTFEKVQLLDKYISEGASVADLNADGHLDIIAGPLWWKGPDFKQSHTYAPVKYFPVKGAKKFMDNYATNFFTFTDELTQDEWLDIIKVGLPRKPGYLAINPAEQLFSPDNTEHSCEHCIINTSVDHESPQYLDIIGDNKKELLFYYDKKVALAQPSPNAKEKWQVFTLSKPAKERGSYVHGLGAGDINGDGLKDVMEKSGWWEQPKNWDKKELWIYNPYPFAPGKGGAQMFAFDMDGDGNNDVVTALDAHGYGLAWYEHIKEAGKITFKPHHVMGKKPKENTYGVCFSQLHAMDIADIDGDGVQDIITGKTYYAHIGRDPGAEDPAVIYWFKTQRNKDGSVELIPYLIGDNLGIGRQISVAEINKDGKIDIVTANKKGVHAFIQK